MFKKEIHYESPSIEMMEMEQMDVICSSKNPDLGIEDGAGYEDLTW